jgi:hypothetical protein
MARRMSPIIRSFIPCVVACALAASASAGGSDCALCKKPIPAGKGVTAVIKKETRHFRCIHCALTGLKGEKRSFELLAKTPLDGRRIRLTHSDKGWRQEPKGTVFLILPERAGECLDVHQPFASKAEFDSYLKLHPEIAAQKPKAYTIGDYEKMLEAGKG